MAGVFSGHLLEQIDRLTETVQRQIRSRQAQLKADVPGTSGDGPPEGTECFLVFVEKIVVEAQKKVRLDTVGIELQRFFEGPCGRFIFPLKVAGETQPVIGVGSFGRQPQYGQVGLLG